MAATKLKVVEKVRTYDEREKIFDGFGQKKGKEKEKFLARDAQAPYLPDKLRAGKSSKGYMVKDNID